MGRICSRSGTARSSSHNKGSRQLRRACANLVETLESRFLLAANPLVTFNWGVGDMVADPARPLLYASLPASNNVAVLNTKTLQPVCTIPVGPGPTDLDLSADGKWLYVANSGETSISVIDTQTLAAVNKLNTPNVPYQIAAGRDGEVFLAGAYQSRQIIGINTTTGQQQTTQVPAYFTPVLLSSGASTLYVLEGYNFFKYDLTTGTPTQVDSYSTYGASLYGMAITNDGEHIVRASGAPYAVTKVRTSDMTEMPGFNTGAYPERLAISPDDSVIYVNHSQQHVDLFDFTTTASLGQIDMAFGGASSSIKKLAVDITGARLFAATAGTLHAYATGRSINFAPEPDAGGPYALKEGQYLTLDASNSTDINDDPLTYAWDLNSDGIFTDAAGVSPTLSWEQIQALGLGQVGQTVTARVRVSDGHGASADAAASPFTIASAAGTPVLTSSALSSAFGDTVTFTIAVGIGVATPSGSVILRNGSAILATLDLDAAGRASFTTTSLSVGQHRITASYSGDGNYPSSESQAILQSITRARTAVSLAASVASSRVGEPVTFTATVSSPATLPTGNVRFLDGAVELGTVPLDGSGQAAFTATLLGGSHTITASYGGDGNFETSSSLGLVHTVSKTEVSVTLSVLEPTSTLLPVLDHRDLVFDYRRGQLLITTAAGTVLRYDVEGRRFLSPIAVGASIHGADITPDGRYLFVTEYGTYVIHKVDLDTGAVTNLGFERQADAETGGWDLVATGNATALFTTTLPPSGSSGSFVSRQIQADGTITRDTRSLGDDISIVRSDDYSLVVLTPYEVTNGTTWTFLPATGTFANWATNASWLNFQPPAVAVNRDGSRVALHIPERGIVIRDRELHDVTTVPAHGIPAFDPQSGMLYVADAHTISVYDPGTWTLRYAFPIGEPLDAIGHYGNGVMTFSTHGRYLFLATTSGVRMFDLIAVDSSSPWDRTAILCATVQRQQPGVVPAGTVIFTDTSTGNVLGSSAVLGGSAILTVRGLSIGTHPIQAIYSGDDYYDPASSNTADLAVERATTQTVLTNASPDGEQVIFTALVTTADGLAVSGMIRLLAGDGEIATATLANGIATFVIPPGYAGQTFRADFAGSDLYAPSTSATLNVQSNAVAMIDVLAVYTTSARQTIGNTAAAVGAIRQAIADANHAFANSSIGLVLRLVHVQEVDYNEAWKFEDDLQRLRTPGDGMLDMVPQWRDQYHADVVAMFIQHPDNTLGVAYQMRSIDGADNPDRAYLVVNLADAAAPTYTFAHELGHNLGAGHDIAQNDGPGALAYSYGYRVTAGDGIVYRDLMGYPPGVILPYFSSPDLTHLGMPVGSAQADNRRTILQTAQMVAGYRSAPLPAAATVTLRASAATSVRGQSISFTATVQADGGPASGDVVFYENQVPLARVPVVNGVATWTTSDLGVAAHSVWAWYAGDAAAGAASSAPVKHTVLVNQAPRGAVETASAQRIAGWAFDGNAGTRPATVRIDIDGKTRVTIAANRNRPDLRRTLGSTAHGFAWTLPALPLGRHTIAVYVIDHPLSTAIRLRQYTVNVGAALFDKAYYLRKYPVAAKAVAAGAFASAWDYYLASGQALQHNPAGWFDERFYRRRYADVAKAIRAGTYRSGFEHYVLRGQAEGRTTQPG